MHLKSNDSWEHLRTPLRKVCTEHAVYTKFVITDILETLTNVEADLARLLKNQEDIGYVLRPYIGIENAQALTQLLKTHIEKVRVCIIALKSGNTADLNSAIIPLFENSDQIGFFLTRLNPEKLAYMSSLFRQHSQYVLDIAKAQLAKEYENVIKLYDSYYNHMMMIADRIAEALD
jgi:hypothetical protein